MSAAVIMLQSKKHSVASAVPQLLPLQDSCKHDNRYHYNSTGTPVGYMEGDFQAADPPELKSTQDKSTLNPTGYDTKPCNNNQCLEAD